MGSCKSQYPTYIKVYSVYAYDHTKYRKIYLKLGELATKFNNPSIFYRVNPYRIMEHCYYYDEQGKRKHLKDIRHVYRLKALHKIYEEIAGYTKENQKIDGLKVDINEYEATTYEHKKVRGGFKTYKGECFSFSSAELAGMELKPIKDRLKAHIALLRLLRKGEPIQESVKEIIFKFDSELNSREMKAKIEIYKRILLNYKKLQVLASI